MTRSTGCSSSARLNRYLNQGLVCLVGVVSLILLLSLRRVEHLSTLEWSSLVSMGTIGIWRWSWFGLHILRAWIYQHLVFPHWRRRANRVPLEDLPPVCLLVPTYKEKAWITEQVFRSVGLEARSLKHPITVVTVSSGPEEDAAIVEAIKLGDPDLAHVRVVHAADPGDGKRKALAVGLRAIAQLDLPANTIIALMDGDSELGQGTLRRCLPMFNLFPRLGALTTDEVPIVKGSYWFSEWFHLRFSQRHYQMSSISLSKKVLCLTGRFSLYRAEAALHPTFAEQLENDTLDDWLWGTFKFLSGDDKSTWYWMLRQGGYDLLYVPDVTIYSIESISGSLVQRMYQNMRRWFGNMLRNGNRALALGPRRLGFFVWLCLLDQRMSMWTSLVSPCLLLTALLTRQWLAVGILFSWLVMSRSLTLTLIFWGRESYLKLEHLPILLLSQWSSAVIKIWTQMNLSKQRWFNRGDRKLQTGGSRWTQLMTENTSRFLLGSQAFGFGVILFTLLGIINPMQDVTALWHRRQVAVQPLTQVIEAIEHGVIPNDSQDDAIALQQLLASLPPNGNVQISLPIGEIDLHHPLTIHRSNTFLKGQGMGRTILCTRINQPGEATAVIQAYPLSFQSESGQELTGRGIPAVGRPQENLQDTYLRDIRLSGFTLRPADSSSQSFNATLDGILLQNVEQARVASLHLQQPARHGLVLDSTQHVTVQYVTITGNLQSGGIHQINTSHTQVQGLGQS
ncbi:MAG: glycosyltransferase [Synechococcales bacterium]|nr:glycosyltransferase [Synechococcales bacterium]